ncbi:MAG: hypothetical protein JO083_04515 [Candidatus Eremiobacteraeota bacterium]|nr:hypothetical protein [Candidatus Eremiobacteraeota bacterium]
MADRRSFLGAAVSGVAASVLLASKAGAQAGAPEPAPASSPRPAPSPSPKPSASPKPPSPLAAALALSMRRFDTNLADKDLDTIALAIDDNRKGAARLNPNKATTLKNGDEPVTRFAVERSR